MNNISQREEEIEFLYEQEGLTYRAIAQKFQLSPSRIATLYKQIKRKRREGLRRELAHAQGREPTHLELTVGELELLRKMLSRIIKAVEGSRKGDQACFTGQDYALAQLLERKLAPKEPPAPPPNPDPVTK